MKAVVFHDVGDIRLEDVPEPRIEQPTDAIVRLTASAICGTDLHMIRGTLPGMQKGTILGHEGVGEVVGLGAEVRNFSIGDRVVVPSTIGCGYCSFCRSGYHSQCDNANPNGKQAGTAFYGGPQKTGPFHGLQAEMARIPFAGAGMVRLPEEVGDDDAIMLSDVFPTGYFGADLAGIRPGQTVAVFGCGPVGQFAILGARLMSAGRIFAIDAIQTRLEMARAQGAEIINFNEEDPMETLRELTGGNGADCAIDAVGVDAYRPHRGPAAAKAGRQSREFAAEVREVAPHTNPEDNKWIPGDAPSQALRWAVEALAKAGTLAIVGVYSPGSTAFPIGAALGKNLTIRMGNCNHRKYIPGLLDRIRTGQVVPSRILTQREQLTSALEAYKLFDTREPGWIKVELKPAA